MFKKLRRKYELEARITNAKKIREFVELQEEYFKEYGKYWNEIPYLYTSIIHIYNTYSNLRDEEISCQLIDIVNEYERQLIETENKEYKQYVLDQIKED